LGSVTSSLARSIRRATAELAELCSEPEHDGTGSTSGDMVLPSLSASVALGAARDTLRASNRTSLTGDLFSALHDAIVPVGSSLSLSPLDTEAEPLIVGCGPWALDPGAAPAAHVSPAGATLRLSQHDASRAMAADPIGFHQPSASATASASAPGAAVQRNEWDTGKSLPVVLIACSCTVGFRLVDTDAAATNRGFASLAVIMCRAVRWLIVYPHSGHVTPMLGQVADVTACSFGQSAPAPPASDLRNPLAAIRAARKLWGLALPAEAAGDDEPRTAQQPDMGISSLKEPDMGISTPQETVASSASEAAVSGTAAESVPARVVYGAWKLPPARITVSLAALPSAELASSSSPQPQPRRLAPHPAARPRRLSEDRLSAAQRLDIIASTDAVEPARVVVRLSDSAAAQILAE
jgi:hypothetical protein